MASPTKRVGEETKRLDVKKGEQVRLLLPFWDGVQRFESDAVIHWPCETPPTVDQACLVTDEATPLDAPVMSNGEPSKDYIDPTTNKPLPPVGSR